MAWDKTPEASDIGENPVHHLGWEKHWKLGDWDICFNFIKNYMGPYQRTPK